MNKNREHDLWYEEHSTNVWRRLNKVFEIGSDNMHEALYLMFEEGIDSYSTDEEFEDITDFHYDYLTELEGEYEPYMTESEYWRMTM